MIVKIKAKDGVILPEYSHEGDAGMDVRAFIDKPIIINEGETKLISTGVYVKIPEGYEIQVRSRSGLSLKQGVFVINAPGTIDSNYINEIGVILHNSSKERFIVNNGDRIAQLILNEVPVIEWKKVDSLEITNRNGGFGSSGIK